MAVIITRRERFSAGHTLYNPDFSDEKNREVFGKCSNPNGHGHNYVLDVSLAGDVDPVTGFVYDLGELGRLVRDLIVGDVDHRNLNLDVEWLNGVIPTTENLACAFWDRIEPNVPPGLLYSVRLKETEKNWAERLRG